ncbi:hypothetical protein V6N13_126994 [Hibiscus sabdariffa]
MEKTVMDVERIALVSQILALAASDPSPASTQDPTTNQLLTLTASGSYHSRIQVPAVLGFDKSSLKNVLKTPKIVERWRKLKT